MALFGDPKFNPYEEFVVPDRRTWMIEWSQTKDGSRNPFDLVVTGQYIARNVSDNDGKLKVKANKTASVWLYAGATVGFANQAVADASSLEIMADTVRPPFKLPDWFMAACISLIITATVTWMIFEALTGEPHEHFEKAAEELKRSDPSE